MGPKNGKGSVHVLTKNNEKKCIHDVLYVRHLNVNFISIGQLLQNQYDSQFFYTCCASYDKPPNKRLIAKIEMTKNRIFPLSLRSSNLPQFVAHTISSLDESWLWHCTFSHIPFKSLNILHKQSMVKGLAVIHEQHNSYENYIIVKHQRDNFPTSTYRSKEHIKIVHTDLCGPMQIQSIGSSFYFLTFIDDFIKKIWFICSRKNQRHSPGSKSSRP